MIICNQAIAITAAVLLAGAVGASGTEDMDALLGKMRNANAVQIVYRNGAPHTDRQGRRMTQYKPGVSFFQIGVWGNPYGEIYGVNYDLKMLGGAGFNTMWPWPLYGHSLEKELEEGRKAGLQVVHMGALDPETAARFKNHPSWLGNVWHDEPTGSFWDKDMEGKFKEFQEYRSRINRAAPGVPVFINDVPWITPPATGWWVKWNTAGDVACHDNYPLLNRKARARSLGDEEQKSGIPITVNFAAAVNQESKPVWVIVGAFVQQGHGAFPFRIPTPDQLRAQVYAAVIHGATGIIYFCWDTYVCRDGGVIGMSPDPRTAYVGTGPNLPKASPAKPMQLAESKAAWMAAVAVNKELRELEPAILSPTAGKETAYSVEVNRSSVTDNPLRCLLKPHPEGGHILLTVNLDDAVLNATYRFPAGLKSAAPLFEERPALALEDRGKTFSDLYEPFETHIYRLIP
ncbi:MAG: beta-galactosidase [Armatimonadetes bacterium]|nr:beta-galactosidase [Armatimonadota bacterium]